MNETAEKAKAKSLAEARSSQALLQDKQKQANAFRQASTTPARRKPNEGDLFMEEEDASKPLERATAKFKQETARRTVVRPAGDSLTREAELLKRARAQSEERERLESQLKQNAKLRLKELKPK